MNFMGKRLPTTQKPYVGGNQIVGSSRKVSGYFGPYSIEREDHITNTMLTAETAGGWLTIKNIHTKILVEPHLLKMSCI